MLTATATIVNAASATQLRLSAIVNRPVGGRWKKLNAAALSSEVPSPRASPQYADTSRTAGRYTTLSETTGARCLSAEIAAVATATDTTETAIPMRKLGLEARNVPGRSPARKRGRGAHAVPAPPYDAGGVPLDSAEVICSISPAGLVPPRTRSRGRR